MGKYKSQWTGPQIDEGVGAARNPDTTPTADSDALITSDAVAKVQQGFAPIENDATASQAYAIGDLLVWGGILYKAKTVIAVNDSFTVGTNIEATTIADKLNNIDTEITSNTDTTLTGVLIGNGSKVGTKSLDTSSLTNDADHVPVSSVVKSALDNVNSNIGIVENGNTASHNISKGQYVIWKGALYTAYSAIASGATLASSGGSKNLTAVSGGGLNDLIPQDISSQITAASGAAINSAYKQGHVICIVISGWTDSFSSGDTVAVMPVGCRPTDNCFYVGVSTTSGAVLNLSIWFYANGDVKVYGTIPSGDAFACTATFICG